MNGDEIMKRAQVKCDCKFKEITLKDKKILEHYYTQCGYINSDCNFTNMYMWQQEFHIRYAVIEDCLILIAREENGEWYHTMPIGNGDVKHVVLTMREHLEGDFAIKPLTEEMCDRLEEVLPGQYIFEHMRDMDDYVYTREKLMHLSGKKMHAKRNHVNSFKNTYDYEYLPITEENLEDAAAFVYQQIDGRSMNAEGEKRAAKRLFDHYFELGVKGAVLTVEGKIIAATVGEDQNGTVLIHIEKADTAYKGAYAAINQLFVEREWEGYTYVNREEDMGIEGIRKAKLSYRPDLMVEKYVAHLQ